jgi:hypothetical protein
VGVDDFKFVTPLQQVVEGSASRPMRNIPQGNTDAFASSQLKAFPCSTARRNRIRNTGIVIKFFIL